MDWAKAVKTMGLRYAGVCVGCETTLPAGTRAHYLPPTKTVRCLDCGPSDAPPVAAAEPPVAAGARREHARRLDRHQIRVRTAHPRAGRRSATRPCLADRRGRRGGVRPPPPRSFRTPAQGAPRSQAPAVSGQHRPSRGHVRGRLGARRQARQGQGGDPRRRAALDAATGALRRWPEPDQARRCSEAPGRDRPIAKRLAEPLGNVGPKVLNQVREILAEPVRRSYHRPHRRGSGPSSRATATSTSKPTGPATGLRPILVGSGGV